MTKTEWLIVLAILGILAAIVIPNVLGLLSNGKDVEAVPSSDVTITDPPFYPTKEVQLDNNVWPGVCGQHCGVIAGKWTCYIDCDPPHLGQFWREATEGVTFLYGDDTVRITKIVVEWVGETEACQIIQESGNTTAIVGR